MGKNVDISNQKLTIASASPATPLKLGEYNLLPSKTNLRFIPCAKPIVEKKKVICHRIRTQTLQFPTHFSYPP